MAIQSLTDATIGGIGAVTLWVLLDWLKGLKKESEFARIQKEIDDLKLKKDPEHAGLQKEIDELKNWEPICDDADCKIEFTELKRTVSSIQTKHDRMEGYLKGHTAYVETAMRDGARRMEGLQKGLDSMQTIILDISMMMRRG